MFVKISVPENIGHISIGKFQVFSFKDHTSVMATNDDIQSAIDICSTRFKTPETRNITLNKINIKLHVKR